MGKLRLFRNERVLMARDSVQFSEGWSQDIFRDVVKKKRSQYSLICLHKQFDFYDVTIIRGYDYLANE